MLQKPSGTKVDRMWYLRAGNGKRAQVAKWAHKYFWLAQGMCKKLYALLLILRQTVKITSKKVDTFIYLKWINNSCRYSTTNFILMLRCKYLVVINNEQGEGLNWNGSRYSFGSYFAAFLLHNVCQIRHVSLQ